MLQTLKNKIYYVLGFKEAVFHKLHIKYKTINLLLSKE